MLTNSTRSRYAVALNEGGGNFALTGVDLTFVDSMPLIYSAVAFSVVSCIVSFADLREHLSRLDYPKLQVLEMRIILMIPIYAVFSALSLILISWRFFLTTIRDTYESIVLYIFFMLMIAYCGGEGQLLRSLKTKRYKGMHPFPMCWLPSYPLDTAFYLRCKRWVLQCALIKPVCSFIAMVGSPLGIYREGHFAVNNVYTYTCIIINFSLTWALYYLVLFEIECGKEMHYAKTFLKFLCIKSIIFFSYWQSVCISLASSAGLLYLGKDEEEKERISALIQDLLMCFELLPVAFMHRAAFGRDKLDEEMAAVPVYMKDNNTGNFRSNVDTALNVNDIIDDTIGTIFYRRGKLVDQENDSENDDPYNTGDATGQDPNNTGSFDVGGGGAGGRGGDGAKERDASGGGDADAIARDPTLEELVRHAIATDYGVRVDGALHFDEDEDREERNHDMNFTDTDVILHRSKLEAAGNEVRVDTDLLRSNQAQSNGFGGTPQIYCVVCGRFDREMVRRKNGYKCKECVGTKSQGLLRRRQRENEARDEGRDVTALGSTAREGGRFGHRATVDGVETIVEATPQAAADDADVDEDHFIQPLQYTGSPSAAALAAAGSFDGGDGTLSGALANPAAAIAEGFSNFQNMLRNTFLPGGAGGTDALGREGGLGASATSASGGGGGPPAASTAVPVCGQCRQSTFMVPVDGGRWRCTKCMTNAF